MQLRRAEYKSFLLCLACNENIAQPKECQMFFLCIVKADLFRLPPHLSGSYYLEPSNAHAIFLHSDLICNDPCSVTGVHNVLGAQTEKNRES